MRPQRNDCPQQTARLLLTFFLAGAGIVCVCGGERDANYFAHECVISTRRKQNTKALLNFTQSPITFIKVKYSNNRITEPSFVFADTGKILFADPLNLIQIFVDNQLNG